MSTNWLDVIKNDLRTLTNEVYGRIDENERLLQPQRAFAADSASRSIAPLARRIDKFVREIGFLGVPPWLDVEFADRSGYDNSLAIETFQEQLGRRMGIGKVVAKAHRACVYAPIGFIKTAMPNTVAWNRGFSDVAQMADPSRDGGTEDQGTTIHLDEVPPDQIPTLDLAEVAQIDPEIMQNAQINDLPTLSSMDTPRCEYIDPRHVVTDPYISDLSEAYYIAHLFTRTPKQAALAFGKDESFFTYVQSGSTPTTIAGVNMSSFRPMTNQKLVLLAEVYVRQDPDDPSQEGMFGVIDLLSCKWVMELKKLDTPNRWVAVRADTTSARMWYGLSYIDAAWDDICDAGWVRDSVRAHVAWGAFDALWLPEGVTIDQETEDEINSGRFTRRIVKYTGPRFDPSASSHTRQIPVALLQYDQMVDSSFSKNTGATSTAQGRGETNKVATAFNQEASFTEKREMEIMQKLYDAYIEVAMIATWLVMNYGSTKFLVSYNGITFTMDRDLVAGIANYTISAVNRSAQNPLVARLMMVQQLKELFSNPVLLQQYNPQEIAKLIAALNGWPSRVLARTSPQQQPGGVAAAQQPGSPSESGTSAGIGDGLDSARGSMQDVSGATAGATNRNT